MGGLFILLGALAITIGFWWVVINFFRKKSKKRPALIFAAGFVFVVIGGALAPAPSESARNALPVEEEAPAEPTQAEKDAEAAAAKKAEDDKVAAEKADAEKKLASEKEFYVSNVQSKVDTQMAMFDEAWNTFWAPTFEGLGNGSLDAYAAYDNMESLQQRYETLRTSLPAIEAGSLSKENQKQFDVFVEKMRSASWWRIEAAKKAQILMDENNYSPSKLDEIESDVTIGDSEMLEAVAALTAVEMSLGIDREE